jgi:hypothetical protein
VIAVGGGALEIDGEVVVVVDGGVTTGTADGEGAGEETASVGFAGSGDAGAGKGTAVAAGGTSAGNVTMRLFPVALMTGSDGFSRSTTSRAITA